MMTMVQTMVMKMVSNDGDGEYGSDCGGDDARL